MKLIRSEYERATSIWFTSGEKALEIVVYADLSPKMRRAILLSTVKYLRPCMLRWNAYFMEHHDIRTYDHFQIRNRGIHEPSALHLESETGRFGAWVRSRRIQMGLTQREFAKRLGSTAASISLIERDLQRPRNNLRFAIMKVLTGQQKTK